VLIMTEVLSTILVPLGKGIFRLFQIERYTVTATEMEAFRCLPFAILLAGSINHCNFQDHHNEKPSINSIRYWQGCKGCYDQLK
jgi:hypothetical protein